MNVNCPRSLNINVLPSFFGAVSTLSKATSLLDFQTYRTTFKKRENDFLRNLWDKKDQYRLGSLRPDEGIEVLRLAGDFHWKNELASLSVAKKEKLVRLIFNFDENDELLSHNDAETTLEMKSPRYYYSGCQEIQLENWTGRELKVGTAVSESYQLVDAYSTSAIVLSNRASECRLTLSIDRYKPIHGIAISPYQSSMLPLIRIKKKSGVKQGGRSSLSGFR